MTINVSSFDDFILVADKVFTVENCERLINDGNFSIQNNTKFMDKAQDFTLPNQGLTRQDTQLFLPLVLQPWWATIHEALKPVYDIYQNKHEILKNYRFESRTCKWQKTAKGETGFSNWHMEQGPQAGMADRCLVWMIYLNDVEVGGETEFVEQHVKFAPKQGTAVMWPAGLTHPHRGNPPYSGDKYILTGWFHLATNPSYE